MFDFLTLDQPNGLINVIHAPLVACMSCIFYVLNCVAYHAFLKTLFECMFIVNCLMFRLAERNEDLSTVEAPTSPFCQRQVSHKLPTILTMHD